MSEDYFIVGDDGSKFCRRYKDENGNVQFETKQGRISLTSLQEQAYNPKIAMKNRGKFDKHRRAM